MTPDQRAEKIAFAWSGYTTPKEMRDNMEDIDELIEAITAALLAVRRETLEEAAKVADLWIARYGDQEIKFVSARTWGRDAVADIADAIRALSRSESTEGS